MTYSTHDGCLMCAVRAMTEGEPKVWNMDPALKEGDTVSGVILRIGAADSGFVFLDETVPFVDLWLGGTARARIMAYGRHLQRGFAMAEGQIGDRLTVRYEGKKPVGVGRMKGREYRAFAVSVERGHH